ncbi:MAG: carboxypeptidase-like regulatory domain-containing protein [Phycisphaerales bacterium]
MRPENLDKLIEHLQAQPSRDLDERIDTLLDSHPRIVSMGVRRRAIRSWTARLAVAAAVILAILVGMPLFNGDGGNVWARALENTRKISNYTFRLTRIERSPDPGQSGGIVQTDDTWYVSAQQGLYIEHHAVGEHDCDRVFYELPDSNEWIKVYPATQEYERGPRASSFGFEMPQELPKEAVLSLLGSDYIELGTKTADGRVLMGVRNGRIPDGASEDVAQWDNELWFDRDTMLLASREHSVLYKGSGTWHVTKQDQFRYNMEFPAHVFNPKIPEGYAPTIVNGLRLLLELAGGKYPWSLDELTIRQTFGDRAKVQRTIETLAPPSGKYGYDGLMRAARFFNGVVRESPEFAYFGNRVTAKDGNRVLMYWGGPERPYQVIWGDLRMETLSKDQLIECCHTVGDFGCLLDFLEKDDGTRTAALAAAIGEVGDRSAICALLRHADSWQGPPADNPFPGAIDAICRREAQQNPSQDLMIGRLVYANGRSVTRGLICIDSRLEGADQHGYFALEVPHSDPPTVCLGYALVRMGANARLFFWSKQDQPGSLTIVLDWASTVCGRVLDPNGSPQSSLNIGLTARPGQDAGRTWPDGVQTKTDAEGRFSFENVPIGAPLELVIENPNTAAGPLRVRIDDLASEENRDLGDLVVHGSEE